MPQYRKKERELSFRRSKATERKQQKKELSYFVSDL